MWEVGGGVVKITKLPKDTSDENSSSRTFPGHPVISLFIFGHVTVPGSYVK